MSTTPSSDSGEFWENLFRQGTDEGYGRVQYLGPNDPVGRVLPVAHKHFGDVRGKTILDIGCGNGGTSLYFAQQGAQVIATDASAAAIDNINRFCTAEGIQNVTAIHVRAQDLNSLPPVDFAFGSMILHHIEPFAMFAATLRQLVRPGGRGFFFENNARSSAMIWCRNNLVGKYGIPKFGDAEEFPLTVEEVDVLRDHFRVEVSYPYLHLFRMVPQYLLKGRLMRPFEVLDDYCYRFPSLRKYSYRQFVMLS